MVSGNPKSGLEFPEKSVSYFSRSIGLKLVVSIGIMEFEILNCLFPSDDWAILRS
jgi:hypothetical protein